MITKWLQSIMLLLFLPAHLSAGEFALTILAADGRPLSNRDVDYRVFTPAGADDRGKQIAGRDHVKTNAHGQIPLPIRFPDRLNDLELPQVAILVSLSEARSFQAFLPDLARDSTHTISIVLSPSAQYRVVEGTLALAMAIDGAGYSFRIAGASGTVTANVRGKDALRIDRLQLISQDKFYYYFRTSERPHGDTHFTAYAISKSLLYCKQADAHGRVIYVPAAVKVWKNGSSGRDGTWHRIGSLRWQPAYTLSKETITYSKQ